MVYRGLLRIYPKCANRRQVAILLTPPFDEAFTAYRTWLAEEKIRVDEQI